MKKGQTVEVPSYKRRRKGGKRKSREVKTHQRTLPKGHVKRKPNQTKSSSLISLSKIVRKRQKEIKKRKKSPASLLASTIVSYLESMGWTCEVEKRIEDIRADIFAARGKQSLIVEITNTEYDRGKPRVDGHGYTINYDKVTLYRSLGQAFYYTQYADEVWLVLPPKTYRHAIQLTIPNVKFLPMENWL